MKTKRFLLFILVVSLVLVSNVASTPLVKLNKTTLVLKTGDNYALKLVNSKNRTLWSTSNNKIAVVNAKGKVTAKSLGKATITGVSNHKVYQCKVKVQKIPTPTPKPVVKKSIWKGKKWYAIGDSITRQNTYTKYLDRYCKFKRYYNAGQSGKCMTDMTAKLAVEPLTGYDLVTVFAGTNDFGFNTPLGTMQDTPDVRSFYGDTKRLIEAIKAQNPNIKIVFFTPIKRGSTTTRPAYNTANAVGCTLENYVNAVIEVCNYYQIPYLDLFRCSEFNENTFTKLTKDNLHPNNRGGKSLAKQMKVYLEDLK